MNDVPGAGVRVTVIPEGVRPIRLDAVVLEEDTYLVLSAPPPREPPGEGLAGILKELDHTRPVRPGRVIVRDGTPLRLLAVVHDLSRDPTWRETWVAGALAGVLRESRRRRLKSILLPVLGRVHGRLAVARFVELLRDALSLEEPPVSLVLYVQVRDCDLAQASSMLPDSEGMAYS